MIFSDMQQGALLAFQFSKVEFKKYKYTSVIQT